MRLLWVVLALDLAGAVPAAAAPAWHRVQAPSTTRAQAIGGYSRGCLAGGKALPARARNLRIARPERRRHFGHPDLVRVVRDLAAAMADEKLGMLYAGDLSQPRGGPAPSGHASHQSGLDADLYYLPGKRGHSRSVVDRRRQVPSRAWHRRISKILSLTASDPRVARIFVHPVIKRELCRTTVGKRAWLGKLRPWWGHDSHFHVRLHCPNDSAKCEPQTAIAAGDGCADVEWWFSAEAKEKRAAKRKSYQKKVGAKPPLPEACGPVLYR